MKNCYTICGLMALLLAHTSFAKEIEYGEYSEEYDQCLSEISVVDGDYVKAMKDVDYCDKEEIKRLQREVNKLISQLKENPLIVKYSHSKDLNLLDDIVLKLKYSEMLCNMAAELSEAKDILRKCELEQANRLYIDLYQLQKSLSQK